MALDLIFTPTVTVAGSTIPDFKSFNVDHTLGIAEKRFQIELDRPILVTTDDTVSISYDIGGSNYPLITDKKIEVTDKSTWQTSIRGEGSLISRNAPFRTIIFINEAWLKSVYPNYYLKTQTNTSNYLIFARNPGNNPNQFEGASADRLYIPELPGKDVRDIDFECKIQSGITYYDIAQYIAKKIKYNVVCNYWQVPLQKTFVVNAGQPYFAVFDQLYGNFNPMIYIDDTKKIIYILDIGGEAQLKRKDVFCINLSEDSFSVLKWNITDTNQIVDHVIITGPSRAWTYQKSTNMMRFKRSESSLFGTTLTLVDEYIYQQDSLMTPSQIASYAASEGVTISTDNVFEFSDPQGERNGKQKRTVNMKYNEITGETATIDETTETYNIENTLVHKIYKENKWADYKTPLGHVTKEWARIGKIESGVNDGLKDDFIYRTPNEYELRLISMEVLTIGNFIGDTGLFESDLEQYNLVQYILDEDTIDTGEGEESKQIKTQPQVVTRKSMIGSIPSSWEEPDDPNSELGMKDTFMLTRTETVRFDTVSMRILKKTRLVEEFIPVFSRKMYTEDIPIKRPFQTEMIPRKWEYFNVGVGGNVSIVESDGKTMPQGNFHPVVQLHLPDIVDGYRAMEIARRLFTKRKQKNTTASIRLTAPVPGLNIGMIIYVPTCTKQIFNWTSGAFENISIEGQYMWITGIHTRCSFSGDINSSSRNAEIYVELDLKKNF
jgi:hypothetical protein